MALKNQAGLIKIIDAIECMEKSLSCAICLEISSEPVETRCGHLFCRTCIRKVLGHPGKSCPVCKFNLTRRNVSSSDHMRLCIQQLSTLIDAVRSDTDIDITSCLKTHYKKRAYLPSASSSSPQWQEEIQNQITSLESDNNAKENPQSHENFTDLAKQDNKLSSKEPLLENPLLKPREQTINGLSCKMITKKCQVEGNPLRVQNENILPPKNTSDALNNCKSSTVTRQFVSKVNDETDKPFEENRQCLKEISTVNLNRSFTDESTKTWSRVAKFGKELRRKSGKNSSRIHKKPKLSVNIRDKSVLLNASHDHSTDPEKSGQDSVDYDRDTSNFKLNRHEDDINVSVSQIKETVSEKVNHTRFNQDNEIISKNMQQETLMTVNNKICDGNVESNVETNERFLNSGSAISEAQTKENPKKTVQENQKLSEIFLPSDSPKTVIPENNKGSKRSPKKKETISGPILKANSAKLVIPENKTSKLYEGKRIHSDVFPNDFEKLVDTAHKGTEKLPEERGKLPESLNTSAGNEAENARAFHEKINHSSDFERQTHRTKRTQYANVSENVVRFKKLGHLFRVQRKSVAFLYLGSTKSRVSEIFSDSKSASICKLCSSCLLSDKSTSLQDQRLGLSGRLGRAKSFESATFNRQKLLPLPEIFASRINKGDKRENHFPIPFAPKEQTISPKNHLQSRCLSSEDKTQSAFAKIAEKTLLDENESGESSIIRRKRKRSQSSDHEDQCTEEQIEKRVSKKRSELGDHENQSEEEQNRKRVSKERSDSPNPEDQSAKAQNRKPVSKKQSESSDHEDQCTEEQIEKCVSKKRSESPDYENQWTKEQNRRPVSKKLSESTDREDQCTRNQSRNRASHELSRTENEKYICVDSLLNKTLQALATESYQIGQLAVQEKNTTDMTGPPEHDDADVDPVGINFTIKNAFQEANITIRGNIPRTLPTSMPVSTADAPENINCTDNRDLIGLEACEPSKAYSHIIAQNSDNHEYEEDSEMNLSRASMMDITGEELLLKKFEEHLFGPSKSENLRNDGKRSENNGVCKENTTDSLATKNRTLLPEPLDQRVSGSKTAFVEHNQSLEIEDFVELTPTEQNLNHLNNPPEIIRNKESAAIQLNIETSQNSEKGKAAETPLRRAGENEKAKIPISAQSVTKMRPIYQSTPKSSQVSTDQYRLSAYRHMNQNVNSPIRNLEHKDISRNLKLNPPVSRRGCIICSGLTSKQCEEVRYLSSLFDMQYTKKFSDDVTHIIVKTNDENNGACKTLKYLQGVAYRRWVLNFNWIVDCVAQKKLLNEELYEVVDSTTLITGPRKARCGEKAPFDGFVFYCVEPFQNISVSDYEDLLRHMGATVVESLNHLAAEESIFKIIALQADCHEKKIIEWHQITKAVPVAQEWIVECISQYRLVSLLPFLQELLPQDILDLGFPEELIQDDDSDFMYDMST